MSLDTQTLEALGLTANEIKVYIALLKLGETTTGPIIDESGVAPSKIYTILEKLSRKGLVSNIVKKRIKYYIAFAPSRLMDYFSERQRALNSQQTKLATLITELEAVSGTAVVKETVQFFEGIRGIQSSRERAFKTMQKGDVMWLIGISTTPYTDIVAWVEDFHKRRYTKGITCKYLYNDYAVDVARKSAAYPNSEVRMMPPGIVTHGWIELYSDTVTIALNKGTPMSIVIDNKEIADSFRQYAELLWSLGKPFVEKAKGKYDTR
jgi:HTH-type transcriptional regulator, sugar sensing transcriptional regulator